jgi:hypothetical protein
MTAAANGKRVTPLWPCLYYTFSTELYFSTELLLGAHATLLHHFIAPLYCTTVTGARQILNFWADGSNTLTWQV